jgi:hypothetical protein
MIMSKKVGNAARLKQYKDQLSLTPLQFDFLIGTMLGDGCLIDTRSGKSARLQVRHQHKHSDYVWWKYNFFKEWVLTLPRLDKFNNSLYFRTISHPELKQVSDLFYKERKRIVPSEIRKLLISPFSLAVWMMDDGNGHSTARYFRISTYGFGELGTKQLQTCLLENFQIPSTICSDKSGFFLLLSVAAAKQMYFYIKDYIVPCMRYKFINLTP